jgi:alanine racemase
MNSTSFNRIQINCSALQNNYAFIKKNAGADTPVMAMVKADGYGHGMVMAAKSFARAGCTTYGVAELREGVLLREAGIRDDIYVTIGFDKDDVELIFQHDLTPVIYDFESVRALSGKALQLGREIEVHIKVDTGMSRLGILPEELPGFLDTVSGMQGLKIAGIMSHFPESDDTLSPSTQKSFQIFRSFCQELKNSFGSICHIANSGAVLNFPDTCCDMVRPGISLYGYHPAGEVLPGHHCADKLIPAMSFSSRVLQVKTLPAGTGISYGHTFITKNPTRIAVLPVGYANGYSRLLSNKGQALIHGERVPILGRICMNMCMADVTGIKDKDVQAGDEVVLLGSQGQATITADEIADKIGSISYEVLCMLGNNNQREYIE